jgi:methylase of polypeptide subunit release factors
MSKSGVKDEVDAAILPFGSALSGVPGSFPELAAAYFSQITDAIKRNAHHDQRRALLVEFLRKAFGIEVDEIELEKKIRVAEARGRIDAFYRYVIFEVKVDMDRERDDAIRELKKYFESRKAPTEYIAAVTDGLNFEIYDYDSVERSPHRVRSFSINPDMPGLLYRQLDELLSAGGRIEPSSDDIVMRFGLESLTFSRSARMLEAAYASVEKDSAVEVKYREWNALLSKVYGSAIGNRELFLKHTYLTLLSRAIVTMALFPRHPRTADLYRNLLTGAFFRDEGILNLAEPDFFSWPLETAAESTYIEIVDNLFKRLTEFDWRKVDEDLLKMLYQELVDPSDRSDLGEYYTPDWLAELVLRDIKYGRQSLLDPSCGSGTFLFTAIHLLRKGGLSGHKLIKFAMSSIIGLDVHPVAVLMAKANILLALAPELKDSRDFEITIRVYMADTLQTAMKKGKNYLAVPDGMGSEFAIPMMSVDLNRDLDQIIDQMTAFAQRGYSSDALTEKARSGFLAKIEALHMEEKNLWNVNFAHMVKLIKKRRDTVWSFILKNAFRPAFLRKAKVDVVVGNPPWLSFRDIAEEAYKARIKELASTYELIDLTKRNLFTQMDTSTLFFAHCIEEFLKPGGKIAFVMPKTTILPSKQHVGFQKRGLSRIHDMSKVTVVGLKNQHFFNVKSCVVVQDGETRTEQIPMCVWSGTLPRKNLTLDRCKHFLSSERSSHDFLTSTGEGSHYFGFAIQGATLNPHTLWFVEPVPGVSLNSAKPLVRTAETAFAACKEEKWKLKHKGTVESQFLFCTALSENILPFFVRDLRLVVLPSIIRADRFVMLESDEILAEGYPNTSDWVRKAEEIFSKKSKDEEMTAQDRLDFQHLLTEQNPKHRFVVLYNKSGSNICAGYIDLRKIEEIEGLQPQGFVAESVTYRIYAESEDEARYLVGFLNTPIVDERIKPYQTEGVYAGKRDIHRRPFEVCPIPRFNRSDERHMRIVDAAAEAKELVVKWSPQMEGGLVAVRQRCRELVAEQRRILDEEVTALLDGTTTTTRKRASSQEEELLQRRMF